MTNCEAKVFIEEHIMWGEYNKGEYGKALKKAIKALEQEPILDKIRAEIEAIIGECNLDDYDFCSGLICARKIIDKYKSERYKSESEEV